MQPLDLSKVIKNKDPMKFKSKDLMESTGDKFNDLYTLQQRIDFIRPKVDKTTIDVEYEQQKSECIFKPNSVRDQTFRTGRTPSHLSSNKSQRILNV